MRVGIIGDYNPNFHSHVATNAALQHAAAHLGINVETQWVPTDSLLESDYGNRLTDYDRLFASPGSPYRSFEGMLRGIEFARTRDWPFVGT